METGQEFWYYLDQLVTTSRVVIDRPRGSTHPRYPTIVYPLDYGYLEGTTASDGAGVDVWVGAGGVGPVQGVLCTVDLLKRDTEVKILMGCSDDELQQVLALTNGNAMRGILVRREPPRLR